MNKIVLISLAIFTIQFSSCKKDEVITRSATSVVKEYRNNQLFREFAYTPNRLMQLHQFDYNGVLVDTIQFFYTGNRLDSLYTYSFSTGENYLTKYNYNNDQLISIDKWYSHNYNVKFTLNYTYFYSISYTTSSQPSSGELLLSEDGNVKEHHNQYVASIFNENFESNFFTYNQNYNVLSPFWIIDPLEFSSSKYLVVERIQNTRATNDGSGNPNAQWFYKADKWDIEYTFSPEGKMLTKSILDTHQLVLDSYSYEYLEK